MSISKTVYYTEVKRNPYPNDIKYYKTWNSDLFLILLLGASFYCENMMQTCTHIDETVF